MSEGETDDVESARVLVSIRLLLCGSKDKIVRIRFHEAISFKEENPNLCKRKGEEVILLCPLRGFPRRTAKNIIYYIETE